MPEQERFERLARLEVHYENMNNDISELRKNCREEIESIRRESREDMKAIKDALFKIQEQTSTWKNILWGIILASTTILGAIQWVLHYFGFDAKSLFIGK
jgi:hypothetical protein